MLRIQALNTLRTVTTRRSLHTTLRAISSYTTVTDAIKHDHRELEAYYKVSFPSSCLVRIDLRYRTSATLKPKLVAKNGEIYSYGN